MGKGSVVSAETDLFLNDNFGVFQAHRTQDEFPLLHWFE